jgi:hypothetical protein
MGNAPSTSAQVIGTYTYVHTRDKRKEETTRWCRERAEYKQQVSRCQENSIYFYAKVEPVFVRGIAAGSVSAGFS